MGCPCRHSESKTAIFTPARARHLRAILGHLGIESLCGFDIYNKLIGLRNAFVAPWNIVGSLKGASVVAADDGLWMIGHIR